MSLATGWTMQEIRAHSLRDLDAMAEAFADRARAEKRALRRQR